MKKVFSYFFALAFMLMSVSTLAQGNSGGNRNNPPGGGGPGPCPGGPPCGPPLPPGLAPIDEGVVFLLVSGIIFGVTKLRKKKNSLSLK